MLTKDRTKKIKSVSYAKWGYIFIAPFLIAFIVFQLVPLLSTIYNSFFENYRVGLQQIGPNYVGLDNYVKLISEGELASAALNTVIIWIMGFLPQILISLLLAVWFTSYRLKLKGQRFFKTVLYLPNLIMASAFAMLFYMLFSPSGPINQILTEAKVIDKAIMFFDIPITNRAILAFMNFIMWFGNTMILLMAGIMGIDQSLFESSEIDGAKPLQVFMKVTLPLLAPILAYVIITSMIGGIQLFDIPQVITSGQGSPDRTAMTLVMYLNRLLASKDVGMAGAVSVLIFIVTAILSILVYRSLMKNYSKAETKIKKPARKSFIKNHNEEAQV